MYYSISLNYNKILIYNEHDKVNAVSMLLARKLQSTRRKMKNDESYFMLFKLMVIMK